MRAMDDQRDVGYGAQIQLDGLAGVDAGDEEPNVDELVLQWSSKDIDPWSHAITCLASQEQLSDYHVQKQLLKLCHTRSADDSGGGVQPEVNERFLQRMKALLERQISYNEGLSQGRYDADLEELEHIEEEREVRGPHVGLGDESVQDLEPFEGDPPTEIPSDTARPNGSSAGLRKHALDGEMRTTTESNEETRGRSMTTRSRLMDVSPLRQSSHSKVSRLASEAEAAGTGVRSNGVEPTGTAAPGPEFRPDLPPMPLTKTSASHPLNISALVPPELLDQVSACMGAARLVAFASAAKLPPILGSSIDLWTQTKGHVPKPRPTAQDLDRMVSSDAEPDGQGDDAARKEHARFGNAVLSSCPGKKVRLTGPSRRRGTVNRNLFSDLERVVQYGNGANVGDRGQVRCIVCCLCDEELGLLGAPWDDYEKSTKELGVEVIRLPIFEGSVPDRISIVHDALSHIISRYTIQGHSTLFHCRGGVGRAGLVASCWLLRCGLVSSLFTLVEAVRAGNAYARQERLRKSLVISIVAQTIAIARRRRSIKAIETVSQVCFLIDYINYLAEAEAAVGQVR